MLMNGLFTILLSLGSSRAAVAAEAKVAFDSNVKVSVLGKGGLTEETPYATGTPVKLKPDAVYWISSLGKVPLLVVPQTPADIETPAKLQLPDVLNWPSETSSAQLQAKMTAVIDDLYVFQTALMTKDTTEAQKALDRMEAVQPLDYYSFLHASLAFVKGDMATARAQVQRGLKRYPANQQGLRLLKTIEGAK